MTDDAATTTAAFVRAMQEHDPAAVEALLAADVVLHSPVSARPFRGRELVGPLLSAACEVLEDLTYTAELVGDGLHGLVFTATVDGRPASGVDLVVLDDAGAVAEFTATLRPLSAARAFSEAMGPHAERLLGGT